MCQTAMHVGVEVAQVEGWAHRLALHQLHSLNETYRASCGLLVAREALGGGEHEGFSLLPPLLRIQMKLKGKSCKVVLKSIRIVF